MLTYAGDPILSEYNSPLSYPELPGETVKIINTSPSEVGNVASNSLGERGG